MRLGFTIGRRLRRLGCGRREGETERHSAQDGARRTSLIVGLGNPGPRYERTRHNVGFSVADRLADRLGTSVRSRAYGGIVGRATTGEHALVILKPLTMMNLSGAAVSAAVRDLGIAPEQVVVVYDDVNLDVGRIRVRARGTAGGHRGMQSVIQHLGTEAIPRVRIGIGGGDRDDLVDYVLSGFSRAEEQRIREVLDDAVDAVLLVVSEGAEAAMNRFNTRDR